MAIRDLFRRKPKTERAATGPIEFHPPTAAHFGGGLGNEPEARTLLRETVGTPEAATRAIANRVASLNPQVMVSTGGAGTLKDEILDDHPLKRLIDNPHPDFSGEQFLRLTTQWIVSVGEAYWLKVGSRMRNPRTGAAVPVRLSPIPPDKIRPVLRMGEVVGYSVNHGGGKIETLERDVVLRIYNPDPADPWYAKGYLGSTASSADASKFANLHLRGHYQTDATPKIALEAQEGAEGFTEAQRLRMQTLWRELYSSIGGSADGAPAVIPTHYKLIQLMFQTGKDMRPLLDFWQDQQLLHYGVPRSVLGQVVSGDRSSAEANAWGFDRYTVTPLTTLIAGAITRQLAADFDPALFVKFEEFVSEDEDFRLREEEADAKLMVRTINHIREDRGLDPVPWGADPINYGSAKPYTGEPETPEEGDSGDDSNVVAIGAAVEDDEAERARVAARRTRSARRQMKRTKGGSK